GADHHAPPHQIFLPVASSAGFLLSPRRLLLPPTKDTNQPWRSPPPRPAPSSVAPPAPRGPTSPFPHPPPPPRSASPAAPTAAPAERPSLSAPPRLQSVTPKAFFSCLEWSWTTATPSLVAASCSRIQTQQKPVGAANLSRLERRPRPRQPLATTRVEKYC
ncbi:Iron-sulfur assembly protein IscA chloroplastic, partial [Zea mays]